MHPLSVKLLLNLSVLFGGVGDYARASQLGRLAAVRAQRFFRSGPSTVSTHTTAGSYTFMVSFGISKCPSRAVHTQHGVHALVACVNMHLKSRHV